MTARGTVSLFIWNAWSPSIKQIYSALQKTWSQFSEKPFLAYFVWWVWNVNKPLGCNTFRSAKRFQKSYMPCRCLQPFGISCGHYSFLRLNQPGHPSPPHPLPQCLITSTQFCPSTMESVSLSFYNQAYFHPTQLRTSCAPPFFISTKASSEMPGPAQLCEHSSQKKAK